MTPQEGSSLGPCTGALELRWGIAEREAIAYGLALQMRHWILAVTMAVAVYRLLCQWWLLPGGNWMQAHSLGISLAIVGVTLFSTSNLWCCRTRYEVSRDNLSSLEDLVDPHAVR